MPKTEAQNKQIRVDRKAKILEAALHVFAEDGYHAASISRVSKYAGVSKGLMYNYFESKEDLLHQLLHEVMYKEMDILQYLSTAEFTEESLISLIDKTFELLSDDPKHWKLYFVMSLQPEVSAIMMKDHADIISAFTSKFSCYFKNKFGNQFMTEMYYFNTILAGMKLSFIMDPDNYPVDEMKIKIINQFIKL